MRASPVIGSAGFLYGRQIDLEDLFSSSFITSSSCHLVSFSSTGPFTCMFSENSRVDPKIAQSLWKGVKLFLTARTLAGFIGQCLELRALGLNLDRCLHYCRIGLVAAAFRSQGLCARGNIAVSVVLFSRARMHHKVVGNFGSEAEVLSLYYSRFRFNETSDVGACTHGRPAK